MSGSRQQLDKISVSDIQLMSTFVSAHQSVGKTFLPVDRQERTVHSVTKRRSCSWCRKLGRPIVMLADIAIAVHDGRQ